MKQVRWVLGLAIFLWAPISPCITNGTVDNNRHPNVGVIVAEYKTPGVKDSSCTGTLISPTVFLTAGHCIYLLQEKFGVTQVWVTFDPAFSSTSTLYSGTMHLDPAFPGTGSSDPEDLGVIVLDTPVVGITPAALPSQGLLDRMFSDGSLMNTQFTIVGYGATDTVFGAGQPDPTQGQGTRRYATEGFNALNPDLIRFNQNENFGYGGSNHGDSGGPNFVGAGNNETSIIAAITSSGDTWGIEQNVGYRLDTPEARTFLGKYVILP